MSEFKTGDVLRYTPGQHHCCEGTAYVRDDGRAVDTFWRPMGDGDSHLLTAVEMETAGVAFNVGDFDALDYYTSSSPETWATFHPDDRASISSQHGLQQHLFVRKGAEPHLGTQVENARRRVGRAEEDLDIAQGRLDRARAELLELVGHRSTEG